MLGAEHQRYLLHLARHSAYRALGADYAMCGETPSFFGLYGGAFVTYYNAARLRGCVGAFVETQDLPWLVREASAAALRDRRFSDNAITAAELPAIEIEISILSRLVPCLEPLALVPGVHGIRLEARGRSGCFLPKVALEHQWSAEQMLAACCTMKMGLAADAWRWSDAVLHMFTAEVFHDSQVARNPPAG